MAEQDKKDSVQGEGTACAPEAGLEQKLREAEAKAAENWDLFLRARADFENYRKTMLRDRDASIRRGKRDLFLKLLDIRDNFDRALGGQNQSVEIIRSGIEIVARQVDSLLKTEGVEPIESAGRPFDPAVHEAIATLESPDVSVDTCTDEIQKGYLYQGEVLRAARVRVGRPKTAE
jgi:molecular chaperone GrpE